MNCIDYVVRAILWWKQNLEIFHWKINFHTEILHKKTSIWQNQIITADSIDSKGISQIVQLGVLLIQISYTRWLHRAQDSESFTGNLINKSYSIQVNNSTTKQLGQPREVICLIVLSFIYQQALNSNSKLGQVSQNRTSLNIWSRIVVEARLYSWHPNNRTLKHWSVKIKDATFEYFP